MRVINKAHFQKFGLKASQFGWLLRKMKASAVGFLYSKWVKYILNFLCVMKLFPL